MLPVAVALGDGDEIGAKENPADFGNGEKRLRLGRAAGRADFREIGHRAFAHDVAAGEEFEGGGIGGGFGLNEHGRCLRNSILK